MAYNSKLSTPQIEQALGAALLNEKNQYNITQDKGSNYSTLAEAIAAVSDDKYKVKGIVLTYNTGTDWVSKRYNGEDASGFDDEGNWIDVGGAAGGTQYLDLSMFTDDTGTLSDEDYQKVVKAYNNKENVFSIPYGSENNIKVSGAIDYSSNGKNYTIVFSSIAWFINASAVISYTTVVKEDKSYTKDENVFALRSKSDGTKALTDNGQYAEFAKPTKVIKNTGGGPVTQQLSPNILYMFGARPSLTITLGGGTVGIVNEYMFEFVSGTNPSTLTDIPNVKWQNGDKLVPEANCTYQVSIVNNCAVYAKFPNA